MTDLRDANMWLRLSFVMATIGLPLELFAFAIGVKGSHNAEILFIATIVIYVVAFLLILLFIFFDNCSNNKFILLAYIILLFAAGGLAIAAVAVWGGQDGGKQVNPFSATYDVMAGVLAVAGSVFALLGLLS